MANTISVNFVADVAKMRKGIDQVNSQLGGFAKSAKGIGTALKGAFAFAVASKGFSLVKDGINDSIKAASDLQQSSGAMDAVFGKQAAGMKKIGDTAAESFGLSKNEFNELSSVLGAGFKNSGIKDFAGATTDVIGLGADLAAQFGGSTKDAVDAIGSLMRGETDPIERYGVGIKASAIAAELAAKGQDKLTGAAKTQAEAQARLKLLFAQTKDAQGAFARESDTLAGAQQRNAAATENLKAKFGTILLPILTKVQVFIAEKVLPAVEKFADFMAANLPGAIAAVQPHLVAFGNFLKTTVLPAVMAVANFLKANLPTAIALLGTAFTVVSTALQILVPALASFVGFLTQHEALVKAAAVSLGVLVVGYQAVKAVQTVIAAGGFLKFILGIAKATKLWSAAQVILNVVMSANPIALVIIAIAALVAGIIYAYKHSEKFRAIVDKAWKGIKAVTLAVFGAVASFLRSVWNGIKSFITSAVNGVKSVVSRVWNGIKSLTSTVWNGIKSKLSAVWNSIKTVVSNATTAVKTKISAIWNSVKSITVSAWNAVVNTIKAKVQSIKDRVSGMKTSIANVFRNAGTLLIGAGRRIIDGLLDGLRAAAHRVTDFLSNLTDKIPDWKGPAQRDSKLLTNAGLLIMGSLVTGFEKGESEVKRALMGTTEMITGAFSDVMSPTLSPTVSLRAATGARIASAGLSGSGSTNTYHITIQAGVGDPVAISKEVEKVMAAGRAAGVRSYS